MPHTMTLFLVVNPLICLILKLLNKEKVHCGFRIIPIAFVVFAFLINAVDVSSKSILSGATIVLYLFCFPFVKGSKISNWCLYFCMGYILFTQLIYLINVPYLTSLFDLMYPIGENDTNSVEWMKNHITTDNIAEYRLGGLYRNANQCSRYVTFLVLLFICNNNERRIKENLLFIVLAYSSIVLCGSRTGFVIGSLIIGTYLVRNRYLSQGKKLLVCLVLIVAAAWIVINGANSGIRGMDIESGFDNSLSAKTSTFNYYLSTEQSVFRLMFGHFDTSLYHPNDLFMSKFDSEYGDWIFSFGFVGFIALLFFYLCIFRLVRKEFRICFWGLLWMISSTTMASFRASFIWIMLLSFVCAKSHNNDAKLLGTTELY